MTLHLSAIPKWRNLHLIILTNFLRPNYVPRHVIEALTGVVMKRVVVSQGCFYTVNKGNTHPRELGYFPLIFFVVVTCCV